MAPPGISSAISGVRGGGLAVLLSGVEHAEGPDRELDWLLWAAAQGVTVNDTGEYRGVLRWPHYEPQYVTSSVDAALELTERVLPGWDHAITRMGRPNYEGWVKEPGTINLFEGSAGSPALALIAATLKALIASGLDGTTEQSSRSGRTQ